MPRSRTRREARQQRARARDSRRARRAAPATRAAPGRSTASRCTDAGAGASALRSSPGISVVPASVDRRRVGRRGELRARPDRLDPVAANEHGPAVVRLIRRRRPRRARARAGWRARAPPAPVWGAGRVRAPEREVMRECACGRIRWCVRWSNGARGGRRRTVCARAAPRARRASRRRMRAGPPERERSRCSHPSRSAGRPTSPRR